MCNFIAGFLTASLTVFFGFIVYYAKSKRIKAQDDAVEKFIHSDSLWYRSSKQEQIEFQYKDHDISLWVEQLVFEGTERNCKMHRVHINDNCCAVIMKIRDTHQGYYCTYVQEPYIETEVWDILKAAYDYINQKKDAVKKPMFKESLLKENNND